MSKLEKIKYKPVSVREVLIEMKDLSELMIDLAYSATLFNSRDLAEEVLELEERVDNLAYLLHMNTMLAARDAEDAEEFVGICKVATATNKISDAAADIAYLVIWGIGLHPIVREAFGAVQERLMRSEAKSTSIIVSKSLGELELAARIGVDIIAIRRGKEWIINPSEGEKIVESDILIARGAPHGVEKLKQLADGTLKELG
ncbi:MAG: potassium channel protein [Candidatus Bathyarchaeota archaeon]|nr:potassium channel protein [Candidatus Bathyarchaeota archaeon]